MVRRALVPLLVLVALVASGCGGDDTQRVADDARRGVESLREDARERGDRLRARGERLRDRLRKRIRETLEQLDRAIPEAGPRTREPRRGDAGLEAFLTEVLRSVDAYWTATLRESGLETPQVGYLWPPPGERVRTGCGAVADDSAALYCPADDTIYISQAFASGVLAGLREDLPGQRAGQGRAVGDFGVAYIVAHEYAHNVQQELGLLSAGREVAVKPLELQADCMAGLWGNSVYREGKLADGDVQEALGTVAAVGDFEYLSPQHHGTPRERREAWLLGYESGDPSSCRAYAPR